MNTTITYLKNTPEHIPLLAKWMYNTWGHLNPNASLEKARKKLERRLNEDSLPITYIALANNQPIGMISLRSNGLRNDLTPWLGALYVEPEHRNNGLGEELIKTVVDKAKELNYTMLYIQAYESTLPAWYGKFGWELIGKEMHSDHEVILMQLKLY